MSAFSLLILALIFLGNLTRNQCQERNIHQHPTHPPTPCRQGSGGCSQFSVGTSTKRGFNETGLKKNSVVVRVITYSSTWYRVRIRHPRYGSRYVACVVIPSTLDASLHLSATSCWWVYRPGSHTRGGRLHTGLFFHLPFPSAVLASIFIARERVQPSGCLVDLVSRIMYFVTICTSYQLPAN